MQAIVSIGRPTPETGWPKGMSSSGHREVDFPHHHQLNVHCLQDYSRVWMAASQQHKVDNQTLATLGISRSVIATLPF